MGKSHMYDSVLMVLKTLEYLHNLPELPLGTCAHLKEAI